MATVHQSPADPLAVAGWSDGVDPESKSDRYLSKRLAAAGADYKGVAITTFLLAAGVGAMLWLASGILVEHWLVAGGLPAWARWTWFAVGAAIFAAAVVRWIVPLVRYRVNLVYAARILEREHPELHNDVVNAVLARAHADDTTPLIVKSLRRRAARQLSTVSADGVIDRTPALRLAAVLAGLLALACIYQVLAPKSFVVSAARLVAPWLGIAPPSRVRIAQPTLAWRMPGEPAPGDAAARRVPVQGGTATLIRGRQLVVASDVRGLAAEERPLLVVTPLRDDGSTEPATAAWRVPMAPGGADGMHSVLLPDDARGLDRPIELVISAGDARSPRIRVVVVDAPALLVREVRYDYPEYTGQADETVEWQGDLRAVEGTKVTIVAECNHPLEAAWIDLGCDGKRKVPLSIGQQDLARGRGSFTLHLNGDRSAAEYVAYRLMFQPKSAPAASREPVTTEKMEYRIEVEPDMAPEVSIEEPAEKVVRVPPSAPVTIRVRGEDPDFGLASVSVETRLAQGGEKPGEELLVGRRRKVFRGAATLIPEKLGAGPGAVLEYRAVAKDTRPESPNIAVTEWRALKIDAAAPPREPPPAAADQDPKSDGDQGQPEDSDAPPQDREGQEGEREPGKDGDGTGDDAAQGKQGGKQGEQQGKDSDESGASESEQGKDGSQKGDASGDKKDGSQGENGGDGKDSGGKDSGGGQPQEGSQQQGGKSGEGGRQDEQQSKSQQQDPKQGGKQGDPQEGKDQGGGDGGKPQDGAEGKSGNQQGPRQQQGSRDGDGNEPQGQGGGQQQQGGRPGDQKDGGRGGQQKPSGAGQQGGGRDGQMKPGGEQGKAAAKDTVAADGTDDGEAMERILQHRQQSNPGQGDERTGEQGKSEQGKSEQGASREGQQPGKENSGQSKESQGKDGQSKDGQGKEGTEAAGQKPPECAGADGKPCGKEGCSSCSGGSKSGGGSSGASGQGAGGQGAQSGQGQGAQGQQGAGQQGKGEAGQQAGGSKEEGQQGEAAGQGKNGQQAEGQGQSTDGTGRDGQPQPGDGEQGDGKQGSGQQGAGEQGSGKQGAGEKQTGAGEQAAKDGDEQGEGAGKGQGQSDETGQQPGQQPGQQQGQQQGQTAGEGKGGAGKAGQQGQPGEGSQAAAGSQSGDGGWATGGEKGAGGDGKAGVERRDREMEWGEQDLANARNAADLAIEHLRKSVESGDTTVLDELGWTPEQARDFLARWEAMRRMARNGDARQRGEFDQAVKSLGLRPGGVRSSRDVPSDVKGGQTEGRRSRPPSDYREQFKAFMQGAAAE
ncbi:MAG: hypothetical protein K8S94_11955 [Planctomycetia bacterium]|nr:hypothetical protein [Planctomycetia bacterium]